VDNRNDIREFLASRRARITPQQAGLPNYGGTRRVPGLRREEVALLAGVSPDYYTRLERGNLSGVSTHVLDAIARALQLDEAEQAHLTDLARASNAPAKARRRTPQHRIRPGVQQLLDAMTEAPAFIRNGRLDVLATNRLGQALYAPVFDGGDRPERTGRLDAAAGQLDSPGVLDNAGRLDNAGQIDGAGRLDGTGRLGRSGPPANLARFAFLDPRAADFYPDWEDAANTTVALLHTEAGRDPYDRGLTELVGELSTRSESFRVRWAAHDVRLHQTGMKHLHHPVVGELWLGFEALPMPADPGLTLTAYSAAPGSASQDALRLLASWSATADQSLSPHT
jgi:transcriptional regulator with XRE-family HTH domain